MLSAKNDLSLGSQVVLGLLPLGGYVVNLIELYADESYGGDDKDGLLCVAAYVYERDAGVIATEDWVAALNDPDLDRPLRYFRMSECAHGNGEFSGLDLTVRDKIARKMIDIASSRSVVGFASTVDQTEYQEIIGHSDGYPSPYAFLARMCLGYVRQSILERSADARVSYMFEAGHRHQSHAEKILSEISRSERLREKYGYAGHSFVAKEQVPIVQSADLLVWHTYQDSKKRALGERPRKDYEALIRPQDRIQRWTKAQLEEIAPLIWSYDHWEEVSGQS